jgi:dienelactone hydrolase
VRTDVEFTVEGLTCRGWYYRPDGVTEDRPVIVLCHGMGGVKEFVVAPFAELFVARGYCAFVFDYRYTGASDGKPLGRIIPSLHHDDIRAAITVARQQEGVDREKVILWGASYGGGHAVVVGALDRRVKAVIVLVPGLGPKLIIHRSGREAFDRLLERIAAEFDHRNATGEDPLLPLVAPAGEPCLLPQPGNYEWFMANTHRAPNWLNGLTQESIAKSMEYDSGAFVDLIAPRPFLMFSGENDTMSSFEFEKSVFECAGEPKQHVTYPCGHFGIYDPGPIRDDAMEIQFAWLAEHGLGV